MSCLLNFLRGPRKNQPQMMEKGEPRRRHHRKTIDSFACRGVSSQVQYAEESTSAKGRSNGKQRSSELPGSFPKSDSERLSELPGSFPKKTNEVPSAVADKHDGRETSRHIAGILHPSLLTHSYSLSFIGASASGRLRQEANVGPSAYSLRGQSALHWFSC